MHVHYTMSKVGFAICTVHSSSVHLCLFPTRRFKKYVELYAKDEEAFYKVGLWVWVYMCAWGWEQLHDTSIMTT